MAVKTKHYEITRKRLESYEHFSQSTIEIVARFAQKQANYQTYQAFFKDMGISESRLFVSENGGVPYIDIPPISGALKGTLVVHLPMANPLDPNQLYQIATIAGAINDYRVIAFGNPSAHPYKFREQNLTFLKRFKIAITNNKRPLVATEIDYLVDQGIANSYHVGYSYGALKALLAVKYSNESTVSGIVLVDPVAHPRGYKQLVEDFKATLTPLGEYVNRTELQTYFDARQEAAKQISHSWALLRQINIAIAVLLARADVLKILKELVTKRPSLNVMVAWGSKSELGNDAHMSVTMDKYHQDNSQVRGMRLKDDLHAFPNDVHLYTAIILESLQPTQK